jgi:excinuclease ABC, C subunit
MDLSKVPTGPGIYLMKDGKGKILYIGKAKNLKARLKQYFLQSSDSRPMIPFLLSKIVSFDTIVTANEKEALLLENNLIKEHKPPYNVNLKDDKTYLALKVNSTHQFPMVSVVRIRHEPTDRENYFGPYTSAEAARETVDELHKLFQLRQCSDQELVRRSRPCILYQMHRCMAPCVMKCTQEEYDKEVERTLLFLKGNTKDVLKDLWNRLEHASEKWEFEKADEILKKIRYIEKTMETQKVNIIAGKDFDVWGVYREADEGELSLLTFRSGKLMGVTHFDFTKNAQENSALLEIALLQYYGSREAIPSYILTPLTLSKDLGEIIGVRIFSPQRGEKLRFIDLAQQNAKAYFARKRDEKALSDRVLSEMQSILHLRNFPGRIECIDTSNLSGSDPVAVVVAFLDGKPEKKLYRTYNIKTTEVSDDYQAMREVLFRRYSKAKAEDNYPNLIILDGGRGSSILLWRSSRSSIFRPLWRWWLSLKRRLVTTKGSLRKKSTFQM